MQAEASPHLLEIRVDPEIEKLVVEKAGDGALIVDGESFGLVVLATGASVDPSSTPLIQQIRSRIPANFVGGFPKLDASLRWSEDEDIFVVGCNAGLELGPGALNLMGAMRSARLVAEELHDFMWKGTQAHRTQLKANLFSILSQPDSEPEVDSCSSEVEPDGGELEDCESAGMTRLRPVSTRRIRTAKSAWGRTQTTPSPPPPPIKTARKARAGSLRSLSASEQRHPPHRNLAMSITVSKTGVCRESTSLNNSGHRAKLS